MQAAMVRMDASENIQFLFMFIIPCFRVYQIVLGLMISSLFLIADDLAVVHGDYSLTHGIDDVLIVGNYQNCSSSVIDLFHQSHDLFRGFRIQVSGRLICQKDVRAVYQCSGQCYSLLLTTGEFIRI